MQCILRKLIDDNIFLNLLSSVSLTERSLQLAQKKPPRLSQRLVLYPAVAFMIDLSLNVAFMNPALKIHKGKGGSSNLRPRRLMDLSNGVIFEKIGVTLRNKTNKMVSVSRDIRKMDVAE